MKDRYLLDTNIWIHLCFYTPADIFETLWRDLVNWIKAGTIVVPEEVVRETKADYFRQLFVKEELESRFLDSYHYENCSYADVLALCGGHIPKGKDAEIVAHAVELARDGLKITVVSEEKSSNGAVPLKVPDICAHFHIPCIKKFDFLRAMHCLY